MGFHGRAAASKPYIRKCNAKRRMQWCKACSHWTLEQWRPILWSDELCFSIWQSDGRVWVWRLPGEQYLSDCIVPSVKCGGGMIMVWGRSPGAGLGPLVPVKETLNASACQELLDNSTLPILWEQFGHVDIWTKAEAFAHMSHPHRGHPHLGFTCFLGDNHWRLPGRGGAVLITAWRCKTRLSA